MKKIRRQKAIFSVLPNIENNSSTQGPIPPPSELLGRSGQEEIQPIMPPEPFEPATLASPPLQNTALNLEVSPISQARECSWQGRVKRFEVLPKARQEEIQEPVAVKAAAPEKMPAQDTEPKGPQGQVSSHDQAVRPLTSGILAAPATESRSPAVGQEPAVHAPQATPADTGVIPGPDGTTPLEAPCHQACSTISLAVESLDFGRVLVGNFAEMELKVENQGNHPESLVELKGLPASGFSLISPPPMPLLLNPAGSGSFTVRFSPDSVGQKTATLSIGTSLQAAGPNLEVRLSGEAARMVTTPQGIYYTPVFNSLEMSFVYIPSGSAFLGSPESEPGRSLDEAQYEVILARGFYLQTTPVTQKQWQAVMGGSATAGAAEGDYPVVNVSWHECQLFLQKLNLLEEGRYRLPTESEWEYACRAGGGAALGNQELTALYREYDPLLDAVAWYCGNSHKQSHSVALKSPNPWDLYDMHGNVMEWCQDWYGAYPVGTVTDPVGPPTGVDRVIRGGSWFSSAKNCRCASRAKLAPNSRNHYLGLRLVREID